MIDFSRLAKKTISASDEWFDGNSIPRLHMGYLLPHLAYNTGKFMARDQRINGAFEFPIEKVDIGTADATGPYSDTDFAFPRMEGW
jgi:hypothetical protein